MELFEYKGRTKRGEVMTGMIESPNEEAVASWLVSCGIAPISINLKEGGGLKLPAWLQALNERGTVSLRDRLLFTRQMFTMIRAGVPIIQALGSIQKSSKNPVMIRTLREIRADLEKGVDLSTAISHHPAIFDDYYVNMVRVGENSGQLEEMFRRLFDQLVFENHMSKKIKATMRYPMFVLIAIGIALAILTIKVIPVFADFFNDFGAELPLATKILIGTSNFAVNYWWLVLAAIFGAVFLFKTITSSGQGRYAWDRFKLRIPVMGSIIQKGTLARFCRGLSTASKSGVPLVQAYTLIARVVDNAYYEERILLMRAGIERGESMTSVAQGAGIFSPLELQMIAVGEETGDIDGMLSQVADIYQEEVEYEVERLNDSMEPILLGFVAILVLVLLLGIFMPMWKLGSVMKAGM